MPYLQTDIWEVYEPLGLAAVAISSSTIGAEDPVLLGDYVDGMGLTMPVLLDVTTSVYQDYFIVDPEAFAPYPREFIVDVDGTILYTSATVDTEAIAAVLDSVL